VLAAFAFALATLAQLLQLPPEGALLDRMYTWIQATPLTSRPPSGSTHLTSVMILIITGVGFLIHVYSLGYMHDDPTWRASSAT
jgi:NADH-quinone oxidoreductase subunit L